MKQFAARPLPAWCHWMWSESLTASLIGNSFVLSWQCLVHKDTDEREWGKALQLSGRHVPGTGFWNGASTLNQYFVLPKNGSKYYLKYTFLVFPVLGILGLGTSLLSGKGIDKQQKDSVRRCRIVTRVRLLFLHSFKDVISSKEIRRKKLRTCRMHPLDWWIMAIPTLPQHLRCIQRSEFERLKAGLVVSEMPKPTIAP